MCNLFVQILLWGWANARTFLSLAKENEEDEGGGEEGEGGGE
jgi:hypothetical protein